MTAVRERMSKGPQILESTQTLADAARCMESQDVGDVLVKMDGSFGIVTDRDIVVRAVAKDLAPSETTVGQVATTDLHTVGADDDLDEVVADMRERRIRRVPVVEDGQPIGIVSLGDLAMLRDEDSVLAQISAAPANN